MKTRTPRAGGLVMIASLGAVLGVGPVLVGCSREGPAQVSLPRPVKTEVIGAGGAVSDRSLPGRVQASSEADLAFQIPGVLILLPVRAGQKVARGETIAQLRTDEYEARLTSLQAQLDGARVSLRALREGDRPEERLRQDTRVRAAEAKLANAKAHFERLQQLIGNNAISRKEFELGETNYRVAQEELNAALQTRDMALVARTEDIEEKEAVIRGLEGRTREAEIQLADCTLKAPFDGVVAQRFVDANQSITARTPVVRFQASDGLEVAVDVPEAIMATDLRTVDTSQKFAEFAAAPGVRVPVEVREVAQSADPVTQTFRVRFGLKGDPGIHLLPGMTATVRMNRPAADAGASVTVPVSAIYREGGGEQIAWIIGPDLIAKRRPVKVGSASGSRIEVLEGLQAGDRIAIAGVSFLSDGQKVRDLGNALSGNSVGGNSK
ncbi:MAG: efflux RND transporter periplasmic adaptor subunit [Phycisphaerae bacterium]|nr:efflux RND transporter periplasmic adaptor subunit [Phycisphaerae bacterium]